MTTYHIFAETGDVRPPNDEPWLSNDGGTIYSYAFNQPRRILRKLPGAQVLTEEDAQFLRELLVSLKRYSHVTQKNMISALEERFADVLNPPQEKERTVREKIEGKVCLGQDNQIDKYDPLGAILILADELDAIRKEMGKKVEGR